MRPLTYSRAADVDDALALVGANPASAFLAGGTNEVDLIRAGISQSQHLVDINELPLNAVEDRFDGGLRIGALARMSDVARTPSVVQRYPAVSRALLLSASEQLRNMASMGGNLRQRTRCAYLRDGISPCNKREAGSGCAALDGFNRGHAILGTSEHCIATHPSDVAVALVAFDAVVHLVGLGGERRLPVDDFFLLPGDTPEVEHSMTHGELIVGIEVPGAHSPDDRSTSRSATGSPTSSRWCRSRRLSPCTRASSPTCASPSAESARNPGGHTGPKRRFSAARRTRRRSDALPQSSSKARSCGSTTRSRSSSPSGRSCAASSRA